MNGTRARWMVPTGAWLEARAGYHWPVRLLVPLVPLSLAFLFVMSVIAPRKSKRLQGWTDERLERGQDKG